MSFLDIYCVTDRSINFLKDKNVGYKIGWVGEETPEPEYVCCNNKDNIFYKEKHYSELTFHYWYWKNLLKLNKKKWVGFCQKRRFWIKPESEGKEINIKNIQDHLLLNPLNNWNNYESIICKPINISGTKKIKILKRGWRSLIKKPSIFFNKNKHNIALHFDMHHGHGNLDLAINVLDNSDKNDFKKFVYNKNSFNPHIMFITNPEIMDKWFSQLFSWLKRCEEEYRFKKLTGYDTTRLYAYLAERYLSFWFKKYTKYLENPWIFLDY
jgi:hypothetical protein